MSTAEIGIFGGSGFSTFLTEAEQVEVDTPYGPPSAPIAIAEVAGRRVAFLPRHGLRHEHAPHAIPYRANVWAMRELGVGCLLAPCAVGSLQPDVHPGELVVIDQLVDRTWGRADTYHEDFAASGVVHVAFAEPFDAVLRGHLVDSARRLGLAVHDTGTMVVIQGPRFSTMAESRWFREMGWTVVNMTGYPESVLATELGLPYVAVALVTDYDAGVDGVAPVTQEEVFAVFQENLHRIRSLLLDVIPHLP